jgi:hypothetical protein
VTALNANGTTNTGYRGTVHFTSSDGMATLPADYTFTAGDNGVHTFTNGVTLRTTGSQMVNATDTTSHLFGTATVMVNGGAVATMFAVGGFPSPTTAGAAHTFTVTAQDSSGNTVTTYTGTVHFTSSDTQATLPANYTFVAGDMGVHTFTATLKTAGTRSITATDTVTSITGSQTGIVVNPASATKLAVTGFPSPITAGTPGNFTVTLRDAYNNVATGYRGTVHFTSSDSQAVLPADYTFVAGDNGVHTFTATLKTAGSRSITGTDTMNSALTGSQNKITVNAAAASTLLVAGYPSPVTAGTSNNFTVTARDPYGNTATSYRGTVHFTSSDSQATLPADYTFVAADNGVHTFSATFRTAGTQSLTATDTANNSITGTQSGIVVNPAAPTKLKASIRARAVAGEPVELVVTAFDAFGNVATGFSGMIHFASTDSGALLPADYLFTTGPGGDNGSHEFSVTFSTPGNQSLAITPAKETSKRMQLAVLVMDARAKDKGNLGSEWISSVTDGLVQALLGH